MVKMHWKKRKALARRHNFWQDLRDNDPVYTNAFEIQAENGDYISTETLFDPNNNSYNYYIIAE